MYHCHKVMIFAALVACVMTLTLGVRKKRKSYFVKTATPSVSKGFKPHLLICIH
jgi:hypothetical protein